MPARVVPIPLGFVNAYLVLGERPALVDAGGPGMEEKVLKGLRKAGVAPGDLASILVTHAHPDHAGGVPAMHAATGAPVLVGRADAGFLRLGRSAPRVPRRLPAHVANVFAARMERRLAPFEPQEAVEAARETRDLGVAGRILPTPGHTEGSLSLLLEDGTALVGDLLNGAPVRTRRPGKVMFAVDPDACRDSVRHLLDRGAVRFHVGHGSPRGFSASQVRAWLGD